MERNHLLLRQRTANNFFLPNYLMDTLDGAGRVTYPY